MHICVIVVSIGAALYIGAFRNIFFTAPALQFGVSDGGNTTQLQGILLQSGQSDFYRAKI
jgi:hypothetical protein